jgi:AraC family transcriptional regulator of arabinose operon
MVLRIEGDPVTVSRHMDLRIQAVLAVIETNFCREVSFRALARSVNLSTSRLRHLFKEEVGMTPTQYVKFLRLQRAKQLLETSFLSVKVIMARVGMSNESHFVSDFKKAYGHTPARYRSSFSKHVLRDGQIGQQVARSGSK